MIPPPVFVFLEKLDPVSNPMGRPLTQESYHEASSDVRCRDAVPFTSC